MRLMVKEVRYATSESSFLKGLRPYAHQQKTLEQVRAAIEKKQTICIENTSITGSGKTLANFAAAILDGVRTCGIYPTNELMADQYVSLYPWLRDEIALLDSQGLDEIQVEKPHMRSHAQALQWATGDELRTAGLTNPDVLYLAMYDLYGQMFSTFHKSFGQRVFQNMLNNYPVLAFDEFHLYSSKQIANAVFMLGTAKELAPERPHIFIFSSATPRPQFKYYLQRLGITPIDVTEEPAAQGQKVVCEPLEVNFLPADLLRWQGGDALLAHFEEILNWADKQTPHAGGVFIVDGVYEAKRLAEILRQRYGNTEVGEVHGYMEKEARADALLRRFSVGTTTIDVGIDLTNLKRKEFLVCEARNAAQAIQRLGRLGRSGREQKQIPVPNRAWLAVPIYVYNYLEERIPQGTLLLRADLNKYLNEAYLGQEEFAAYTSKYAPLEAVAACQRVQQQYFEDTKAPAVEQMQRLVPTLYAKKAPENQEEAKKRYDVYLAQQRKIWRTFGTEIKNPNSKTKKHYLGDLESFRGGMEADFTVAIYDELDNNLGFVPVKTYNLPYILRRTQYQELSQAQFSALVIDKHPKQAEGWLKELDRQRHLLGYIHVQDVIEGKANDMYFEVHKSRVETLKRVIRVEGVEINGSNSHLQVIETGINGTLSKRKLNCWISERKSLQISNALFLPPLFAVYPLHALNPNGTHSEWSIAFGLDAFLLESISKPKPRASGSSSGGAIFL